MRDRIAFEECVDRNGYNHNQVNILLQCMTEVMERKQRNISDNQHSWLLLFCGSLIFVMQAGFAMLCAGFVRKKNAQNSMLKNLLDACSAAIAFYFVGYGFAYGESSHNPDKTTTFIGSTGFFIDIHPVDPAFWFFQYTFSATAVTIIAGTLAERCQMIAYLFYSFYMTGFVYPVVAHAVWSSNGFLSVGNASPLLGIGMIDFAGSGVVHLTGGSAALFATYILGSRRGRFYDISTGEALETPKEIKGYSVSLQMLGTMILWFGWFGFNPGSALLLESDEKGAIAAHVAVNTSLAAAGGAISALVTDLFWNGQMRGELHFNLGVTMNGLLSGLVAITAGCGTVEHYAAILIGIIAGWVYLLSSQLLVHFRIDDAVDAVPVHMCNGIWGLIAAGLLSTPDLLERVFHVNVLPTETDTDTTIIDDDLFVAATASSSSHLPVKSGLFYTLQRGNDLDGSLISCQILGVLFICCWTSVTMAPFFVLLNYVGWFRSAAEAELIGLDRHYHNNDVDVDNETTANRSDAARSDNDELVQEYLQAYYRKKKQKRNNKSNPATTHNNSNRREEEEQEQEQQEQKREEQPYSHNPSSRSRTSSHSNHHYSNRSSTYLKRSHTRRQIATSLQECADF